MGSINQIQQAATKCVSSFQKRGSLGEIKKIYEATDDIFERKDLVDDVARGFKSFVEDPYIEWSGKELPFDNEGGSKILKALFNGYSDLISAFTKKDTQRFVDLCFGTRQAETLSKSQTKNKEVQKFVETIETNLGSKLKDVIA